MLTIIATGLAVGILIGLTGIGGGTLMAPFLIFFLRVPPSVAVGTDLFFAGFTKMGGALAHWRKRTVDWRVVSYLLAGSLPGTAGGALIFSYLESHPEVDLDRLVTRLLSAVLLIVASGLLVRSIWVKEGKFCVETGKTLTRRKKALLTFSGFVVGLLITFTSVGSGTLVALVLTLFYRFCPRKMVGTDVVHGLFVTFLGGALHASAGHVDFPLLGLLLAGSLPGVFIGSSLVTVVPEKVLRTLIAGGVFIALIKLI